MLLIFILFSSMQVIAEVGDIVIFKKDLLYQLKVDSIYSGEILSDEIILFKLIRNATYEYVAKTQDIYITDSMLDAEALRIDKETKDPVRLKAIQEVFGEDKYSYRALYVKPIIVNRLLYQKFYSDTLYQNKPYKIAKNLLKEFKEGKISDSTYYKKWLCKKEDPDSWYIYEFFESIIHKLKPQEIYPEIIEDKLNYTIIKLIAKSENRCELEGFVVPKNSFDEWFHSQKVKIKIYDKKMRDGVKNIIKGTYWEKIFVEE